MGINNLINNVNNLLEEIRQKRTELPIQLSYYDLQEQDILHYIENNKLNAAKQSKIFKVLKEIREKRRLIKQEYSQILMIEKQLTSVDTILTIREEETEYQVRTNILIDFIGLKSGDKMQISEKSDALCEIAKTETSSIVAKDRDDGIEMIEFHPEGRRIRIQDINSNEIIICDNFEDAAFKVLKNKLGSTKPKELIKNISGIMKAIKLGNPYLGYKYEILCGEEKPLDKSIIVDMECTSNG